MWPKTEHKLAGEKPRTSWHFSIQLFSSKFYTKNFVLVRSLEEDLGAEDTSPAENLDSRLSLLIDQHEPPKLLKYLGRFIRLLIQNENNRQLKHEAGSRVYQDRVTAFRVSTKNPNVDCYSFQLFYIYIIRQAFFLPCSVKYEKMAFSWTLRKENANHWFWSLIPPRKMSRNLIKCDIDGMNVYVFKYQCN